VTLREAGEVDDAVDAFRRAAAVAAQLLSRSPGEPLLRQLVAYAQCTAGQCHRRAGEVDEAEAMLLPALATLEDLLSGPPGAVPHAESWIFNPASELAELEWHRRRLPEAEAYGRRAVDAAERLVARFPRNAGVRCRLAAALGISGWIRHALGHVEEAERSFTRALEENRRVIRDAPQHLEARRQFLTSANGILVLRLDAGRVAEAAPLLEEAARLLGEAVATQPTQENRSSHLEARLSHLNILGEAYRAEEAEPGLRAFLELAAACEAADGADAYRGQRTTALVLLAHMHMHAGRDRERIEAVEQALAAFPYRRDAVANLVIALGDAADPACRDPRRAVDVARDAIARVPASRTNDLYLHAGSAWNLLSFALICDGRWKEGLEAAAKAVELGYREDGTDWVYNALARAKLGEFDAARDLFGRAAAWFVTHPSREERFARRRAEVERLLAGAGSR